MKINKILETALYVTDIAASEEFYTKVLGFEKIDSTPERDLFLRCGDGVLILFNPEKTKVDGGVVPTHGAVGQGHIAFGIPESAFAYWHEQLAKHSVSIEKSVDWGDGIHSIYFRDPSGNSLEFISENCYKQ
jgi:catechol 2,3-dioxygenase-like lactoylglutathione lyase family enzyme